MMLSTYVIVANVDGREVRLKARGKDEADALLKGVALAKQRYKTEDVEGISATKRECQFC